MGAPNTAGALPLMGGYPAEGVEDFAADDVVAGVAVGLAAPPNTPGAFKLMGGYPDDEAGALAGAVAAAGAAAGGLAKLATGDGFATAGFFEVAAFTSPVTAAPSPAGATDAASGKDFFSPPKPAPAAGVKPPPLPMPVLPPLPNRPGPLSKDPNPGVDFLPKTPKDGFAPEEEAKLPKVDDVPDAVAGGAKAPKGEEEDEEEDEEAAPAVSPFPAVGARLNPPKLDFTPPPSCVSDALGFTSDPDPKLSGPPLPPPKTRPFDAVEEVAALGACRLDAIAAVKGDFGSDDVR